jgi:hypothetical protein
MTNLKEFASSSNGDRWFLGTKESQEIFVLHRGNLPSGGHETETSVQQFLNTRPFGPEREALLALLSVADNPSDDSQRTYTSSSI